MSQWKRYERYQLCQGKQCQVTLERRPPYCDRGDFLAKLFPEGALARDIDGQDGWPRYYFDEDRAKAEIEAWLKKRGQWIADEASEPPAEPMEIVALVAGGDIVAALPYTKCGLATSFLRQRVLSDEALRRELFAIAASTSLMRFRAVETLQQFSSDEREIDGDASNGQTH